ncbi:MAG: hypothetical protein Kapaf2KO_10760 [Candidatus Kapaibacteriales bacterium]
MKKNDTKKAKAKKLSEKEMKNTKGGGFSYNTTQSCEMTAGSNCTSVGG